MLCSSGKVLPSSASVRRFRDDAQPRVVEADSQRLVIVDDRHAAVRGDGGLHAHAPARGNDDPAPKAGALEVDAASQGAMEDTSGPAAADHNVPCIPAIQFATKVAKIPHGRFPRFSVGRSRVRIFVSHAPASS
jgi:hypothetical protein